MDDLHQHLLHGSVETLRNLSEHLNSAKSFTDLERANVLRVLHTIKGTSQTFGLSAASELAGRLESLLNPAQNEGGRLTAALIEGLELLARCLGEENFVVPLEYLDNLPETATGDVRTTLEPVAGGVPREMLDQLSSPEKRSLQAELARGKHLIGLEVGFPARDFAAGLRSFRKLLEADATIIATFPGDSLAGSDRLGFRMLVATFSATGKILGLADAGEVRIIFDTSPRTILNDLENIISHAVAHGRDVAESSGKVIRFEVSADEAEPSARQLKLIFEVLLHLIRNAVDHGIMKRGTITIGLKEEPAALRLSVSDDGCGIDPEMIRAAALSQQLIPTGGILSDEAALELIFRSEFSTAARVTEISGRGVGLDAAKDSIEKAGGTIRVISEINKGTAFEVILPK